VSTSARAGLASALLLAAPLILQLRSVGETVPVRKSLDLFPDRIGEWQGRPATTLEVEVLNTLKVNDYLMRRYVDANGSSIWLYVGYWATQRRGGGQAHSPKNCLPGGGWEPIDASRLAVKLPLPYPPIEVNRYLIQKDRDMQVVLYWYHAQGHAVASELGAKLAMVRSALMSRRTDGALVRASSPVTGTIAETTERLVLYVQALYPVLGEYLPD
jgi:EpsI family protein